jgi:hypothetical protein
MNAGLPVDGVGMIPNAAFPGKEWVTAMLAVTIGKRNGPASEKYQAAKGAGIGRTD